VSSPRLRRSKHQARGDGHALVARFARAGYLFSAPTKNSPGARDLSRRNAGKADPRLEISRLLRRPIFLRTKVRAPFARPANTLNTYRAGRPCHYPGSAVGAAIPFASPPAGRVNG